MDLFPALTGFYEAIEDDPRIGTTHISLYMALLQQWNSNGGNNPFVIVRANIMKTAKINARYTYNGQRLCAGGGLAFRPPGH